MLLRAASRFFQILPANDQSSLPPKSCAALALARLEITGPFPAGARSTKEWLARNPRFHLAEHISRWNHPPPPGCHSSSHSPRGPTPRPSPPTSSAADPRNRKLTE